MDKTINNTVKNHFRQHVPSFVDGVERFGFDFTTTEELLGNEWIKGWSKPFKPKKLISIDFTTGETTESETKNTSGDFCRYSISDNHLMAEFDDGFHWWVLGTIEKPELIDLPKWAGWKHRAILDGEEVVLTDEVGSSCGDVLTLRDGRKARNIRYGNG